MKIINHDDSWAPWQQIRKPSVHNCDIFENKLINVLVMFMILTWFQTRENYNYLIANLQFTRGVLLYTAVYRNRLILNHFDGFI